MGRIAPSAILSIVLLFFGAPAGAAPDLPAMHADPSGTSISGLSSGGFVAAQYAVAYSSSVKGVGVIAAGPYDCALANALLGGVLACMSGAPSGEASFLAAQGLEAAGQIDALSWVARQKVYVFGGTKDKVVDRAVVAATRDFYKAAGVPPANLLYVSTVPAGHAFIAPAFGKSCGTNAANYVNHCTVKGKPYDQPMEILQQIYGPLKARPATLSAIAQPFNQRDFANEAAGFDSVGFVYIPKDCQVDSSRCSVHVVLHGCEQDARQVGSDVYKSVGYNDWADTNHLIVLYPQGIASPPPAFPPNIYGCWDWFALTSPVFQTRSGVQLSAIKAMVDRLTLAK